MLKKEVATLDNLYLVWDMHEYDMDTIMSVFGVADEHLNLISQYFHIAFTVIDDGVYIADK